MAEMTNDSASTSAGIDLSQFFQVFFEEAGENLEQMEQMLLELDVERAPTTRSSTPSSAARIRSRAARPPSASPTWPTDAPDGDAAGQAAPPRTAAPRRDGRRAAESGDALKALLARHQGNGGADPIDTTELLFGIRPGRPEGGPRLHPADRLAAPRLRRRRPVPPRRCTGGRRRAGTRWHCARCADGGPAARPARSGRQPVRAVPRDHRPRHHRAAGRRPAADGVRRFRSSRAARQRDLLDLFTFHVAREALRWSPRRRLRLPPRPARRRPPRRPVDPATASSTTPRRARDHGRRAGGAPAGAPPPPPAPGGGAKRPPGGRRPSRARCACRSRRWTS